MPAPPSHIFVVRHGNRLDAADKKWHLSSPTPYDPPLTYGGFQQARQVGNQIWSILEQAKLEFDVAHESSSGAPLKRRRYKIVIHSSPFLRCVQTSIGISSGLCQPTPGSIYIPSDVIVPPVSPNGSLADAKSAVLRLDSFLGEWLSPEYFESITPPPGSALMMGGAKAELLRRSDYSELDDLNAQQPSGPTGALWNSATSSESAMSTPSEADSIEDAAANARMLMARKGYVAPKPNYAASSMGKIPDGFVSHARDACVVVDYQWDSMRAPLDFGDGGVLGEEWAAMHRRFRKGIRQLINWYCTNEAPAVPVSTTIGAAKTPTDQDAKRLGENDAVEEDVQTVVILVSHGAGCNALMGAITHQPVLMDVGIASITMAERKQDVDYAHLQMATKNDPQAQYGVPIDRMYDIKMSASKEHLQSTSSRPGSARSNRSPSISSIWNGGGSRGRTSTLGSLGGAVMSPFKYSEIPPTIGGSRSASASATVHVQTHVRRDSAAHRPVRISNANVPVDGPIIASPASPSMGLWSPAGSSLRLMQDDDNDSDADTDDFDTMWPNFGQDRFKTSEPPVSIADPSPPVETSTFEWASRVKRPGTPTGPTLSAPIKIQTNLMASEPVEEVKMTSLGDGFGGLWGLPRPPDDAELYRDTSLSKRRWTVNDQS
jgi:broad specificity phosphatase PhoE